MASMKYIIQAVGETFMGCVNNVTPVNGKHVGPIDRPEDASYPYVGFEVARDSPNRGIGNGWNRIGRTFDDEGRVASLEFQKQYVLHIWANVYVDDMEQSVRDDIYEEIEMKFETLAQHNPSGLHTDVENIKVFGSENAQPSMDSVRSQRLHVAVWYDRFRTYTDFEPMSTVNIDVDTLDPESEAEDYDRTFSS